MSMVPIHFIRTEGLQLRAKGTDAEVVKDYRAVLAKGDSLPPVLLFREAPDLFWLADGHHTLAAHAGEGRMEIDAAVREGCQEDALLAAAGANGVHGLRRSNDDKRSAVLALLSHARWGKMSNVQIAAACGVDQSTVKRIRDQNPNLCIAKVDEERIGADGKVRKLPAPKRKDPAALLDELLLSPVTIDDTIPEGELIADARAFAAQREQQKLAAKAAAQAQAATTRATTGTPPSVVPGPPPSASETPADLASAEAVFAEAQRLGQVDAADSAPRSEAELWQALAAFAKHKIPKEPRPALRTAYLEARALAQRPAPGTYPGLFEDSQIAGLPPAPSVFAPRPAERPAPAPLSSGPAPAHEMQLELGDEEEDEDEDDFDADVEALNITPADLAELAEEDGPRMTALDRALNSLDEIQAERDALRRELAETRALADRLRETGRQRFAEVDEAREQAVRERDAARAEAATLRAALLDTEAERDAARAEWAEGRRTFSAEIGALRGKLDAAEVRLTERGQQLQQQRQDGADLLRRAEKAEEECERLRREVAQAAAEDDDLVPCEGEGCTDMMPRPPGGSLALCAGCRPKDLPARRPAGVLGLPLTGQHLGGAPGALTGTWSELGASWARWYLQHTSAADRARQAYDAQGLALYCAERLLQYELEWEELRPAERAALCQGIEQGLDTLTIERDPSEPAPAQQQLLPQQQEPGAFVTIRDEPPKKTRAPRKARKEAK